MHSGWAAFVVLTMDGEQPRVLARGRPHLVETFTYRFRQPYHTAESMAVDDARVFISAVETEAMRLARSTIQAIHTGLQEQGHELAVLALLRGAGKPLPKLDKILASHALIHTADGELFREALVQASEKCSLAEVDIKEKELVDKACQVFRFSATRLNQEIANLGKPIGPPWSQDEKLAALAAWLALHATPDTA